MRWKELREELRGKLFLSSMMNVTNGAFCAERSEGCAMVQIGAYLAEPHAYGKYNSVLPPDREECIKFLADECRDAKSRSDVRVCLNLAAAKLEWAVEAAEAFREAGGDIVELNAHGAYQRYLKLGLLSAMVLPENRPRLRRWLEALSDLDIPLIVKFKMIVVPDYPAVLDMISDLDLFGVHFNVRDPSTGRPNFRFVEAVRDKCPFLLVSGYVRSAEDARRLFAAGADMVGIAEPTIKDAGFIGRIAGELRR
jgi:tRNA-dihydrouridine synthase